MGRRSVVGVCAALALCGSLLGGCADSAEQRAALLEQENRDLRDENSRLEQEAREAANRAAMLDEQNASLNQQLADARSQPAGGSYPTGDTGFEGIEGVSSQRLAGGAVVVDVAGDVLFDSGRVTLKTEAKRSLDRVAQVINSQYGTQTIRIEGHTDSDPIRKSQWKTNERLGAERALAVEEYLASKGVSNNRMYVASFGPSVPKGSKKDSRRVEIVILAN